MLFKSSIIITSISNANKKALLLWKDLKEAVSGTEQDFTEGKLGRAIFLLSVPMVLEMIMESIFAVVDIYFVSKLGADAVATVGITESIMFIIYAIGEGLGMGTTALVSRRIGEKNKVLAEKSAMQAILLGIMISLPIAIPGIFWSKQILQLMGASEAVIADNYLYTSIILSGNIVIMLLFVINAIFRSAGDAAISMRVLWMANLINLVLDPLLIFGWGPIPAMGIKGAAVATVIGRGLAVLYQFYLLFFRKGRISLNKGYLQVEWDRMKHLIRISAGGIGQFIIGTASWIGLTRLIASFGSEAVAGYTIAIRIVMFVLLPSWGLSNAAATLVGQNLGAGKPDRAGKAVRNTAMINMVFLGTISIFLMTNPELYVSWFIDNEQVIDIGKNALKILSYGFIFYGIGMVMIQAFNGAGDTKTPTIINFFCFWLLEIPLAYFLSLQINELGIFYSVIVAEVFLTIVAFYLFNKGRWKLMNV